MVFHGMQRAAQTSALLLFPSCCSTDMLLSLRAEFLKKHTMLAIFLRKEDKCPKIMESLRPILTCIVYDVVVAVYKANSQRRGQWGKDKQKVYVLPTLIFIWAYDKRNINNSYFDMH
ncbi:hypothetical protein CBL_04881 [Carabus blaptoides fortunei]